MALTALGQAGCSLTGLSDFDIPTCESHDECAPLNEAYGIAADACVRYHCAADSLCRLQPIDLDGDGHASAECAGSEGCGPDLPCDDCDDASAVAFPGQVEVCDGVDNDCNLVVDDLPAGGAPEAPVTVVSGTGEVTWHAYGAPLGDSAVAPVSYGARDASFSVIERDAVSAQPLGLLSGNVDDLAQPTTMMGCPSDRITIPAPPTTPVGVGGTCTSHEDCSDGVLCNGFELCDPSLPSADPETGCTPPESSDNPRPCTGIAQCSEARGVCELGNLGVATGCSFNDLDAAELAPGAWFGAMVEQTGCGGLLRIGYFTEGAGDPAMGVPGRNLLFRGTVHRSTIFRGVDRVTTGSGACTGLSRAEGEAFGARLPSIAALPANERVLKRPQALAAWLVPNASGGQPVEVIGVWQEQYTSGGTPVRWVHATGDGAPQRLDSPAVGDVRPSVLAWDDASKGYLVGYGVAGGGIALRFVPAFPDPAEVIDNAPYTTPIAPGASAPRTSPPIADLGVEATLETNGEARGVTLVIGRRGDGGAELGLAWQDADGVRFSTLTFDAAAGTFEGFAPQPVASGEAAEIALGYTADSVVLPGYERGGVTATSTSSGGWLLAWRAGGAALGARFAELDGARIGPDVFTLGADLGRLHIYNGSANNTDRLAPRLVYHDRASGAFRTQAFCGPTS